MKKILTALFATVITTIGFAQGWTADKAHTKLGFEVTHLLVTDVDGAFKSFDISINASKDDFTDAIITVTADISSISTDNDYRDNDLKSDHFFDAAKYPTLTFKSTSLQKIDTKNYKLSGNLTMHGVTNKVTFPATINIQGGKLNATSKFDVYLSDYKIRVPSVVSKQVSDNVAVTVNCSYEPYNK